MVRTVDIRGKKYNAYRCSGMSHLQATWQCIEDIVGELEKSGCMWITNVTTDRDLISISALDCIHFPGESKPSQIYWYLIALNETDKEYCHLRERGLSEAEVRDQLLNEVEACASELGTIKTWHIGYLPGYAVVVASV